MLSVSFLLLLIHCVSPQIQNTTERIPAPNQPSNLLLDDVRWLQFVNNFQTQLSLNSNISDLPMCTTWISNNHQITKSLNKTISNLEKWGRHCVSNVDCVTGRLSFQNQGLSIADQLDAGVRRLVLELHYLPGMKRKLRLCASLQGNSSRS